MTEAELLLAGLVAGAGNGNFPRCAAMQGTLADGGPHHRRRGIPKRRAQGLGRSPTAARLSRRYHPAAERKPLQEQSSCR